MKAVRIALMILLFLSFFSRADATGKAAGKSKNTAHAEPNMRAQRSDRPAFLFPMKTKYVTQAGEPFILGVQVECLPGREAPPAFVLNPPTPDFVRFGPVYRNENSALAILSVNPDNTDIGTHRVQVFAAPCGGGAGDVFNFTIKVKRAQ